MLRALVVLLLLLLPRTGTSDVVCNLALVLPSGMSVQGGKPDAHLEHRAWHCVCHQESEEEHIDHTLSASSQSLVFLISEQVLSQVPLGRDDVPASNCVVVVVVIMMLVTNTHGVDVVCALVLISGGTASRVVCVIPLAVVELGIAVTGRVGCGVF